MCIIKLPTLQPLFVSDLEGGHCFEVSSVPSAPPSRTWLSMAREPAVSNYAASRKPRAHGGSLTYPT